MDYNKITTVQLLFWRKRLVKQLREERHLTNLENKRSVYLKSYLAFLKLKHPQTQGNNGTDTDDTDAEDSVVEEIVKASKGQKKNLKSDD